MTDQEKIQELVDTLAALWRSTQMLERKHPEIFSGHRDRIEKAHQIWMKHNVYTDGPEIVQSEEKLF